MPRARISRIFFLFFIAAALPLLPYIPLKSCHAAAPVLSEEQWLMSVYQKGKELYDRGEYNAAVTEWDKVKGVSERYPAFRMMIDYLKGRSGEISETQVAEIEKKLEERRRAIQEIFQKGKTLYDRGRVDEAFAQWDALATYLPEDSADRRLIADLKKFRARPAPKKTVAPRAPAVMSLEEAAEMRAFFDSVGQSLKKKADEALIASQMSDGDAGNELKNAYERSKMLYYQGDTDGAIESLQKVASFFVQNSPERRVIEKLTLSYRQSQSQQKVAGEAMAQKAQKMALPGDFASFTGELDQRFSAQLKELETESASKARLRAEQQAWALEDLRKGQKAFDEGNFDEAIRLWEGAASRFENEAALRQLIEGAKRGKTQLEEAKQRSVQSESERQKSLQSSVIQPLGAGLQRLNEKMRSQSDSFDTARASAEKTLADKQAAVAASFQRGQLLYEAGKVDEAVREWEKVTPSLPPGSDFAQKIAELKQKSVELGRAKEGARQQLSEKDRAIQVAAADALAKKIQQIAGKLESQQRELETARQQAEKSLGQKQESFNAAFEKGQLLYDAGKFDEARREWERIASSMDDPRASAAFLADMDRIRERTLGVQKEKESLAVVSDPKFKAPADLSSIVNAAQSRLDQATQQLEADRQKNLRSNADRQAAADAKFEKARVLYESGKSDEAMQVWSELASQAQDPGPIQTMMAELERLRKEYSTIERSKETIAALAQTKPQAPAAFGDIVQKAQTKLLLEKEKAAADARAAEQALSEKEAAINSSYSRGQALFDKGDLAGAQKEWERALVLVQNGAVIQASLKQIADQSAAVEIERRQRSEQASGKLNSLKLAAQQSFKENLTKAEADLRSRQAEAAKESQDQQSALQRQETELKTAQDAALQKLQQEIAMLERSRAAQAQEFAQKHAEAMAQAQNELSAKQADFATQQRNSEATLAQQEAELKNSYAAPLQKLQSQIAELEKSRAAQQQAFAQKQASLKAQSQQSLEQAMAQAQNELKAKQVQMTQEAQQAEAALAKSQADLKASFNTSLKEVQAQIAGLERSRVARSEEMAAKQAALQGSLKSSFDQAVAEAQADLEARQAQLAQEIQEQEKTMAAQLDSRTKAEQARLAEVRKKMLDEFASEESSIRAQAKAAFAAKEKALEAFFQQDRSRYAAEVESEIKHRRAQLDAESKKQEALLAQKESEFKAKAGTIIKEQEAQLAMLEKSLSAQQEAYAAKEAALKASLQASLDQALAQTQNELKAKRSKLEEEQKQLEVSLSQKSAELGSKNDATLKALQEQISGIERSRVAQQEAYAAKEASMKASMLGSLNQASAQAHADLKAKQTQLAEEAKAAEAKFVQQQAAQKASYDASLRSLADQINALERSRIAQAEAYASKEASLKAQSQQSLERSLAQAQDELKAKQALIAQEAQAAEAALARSQAELKTSHDPSLQKLQQQIAELEKSRASQAALYTGKENTLKTQIQAAFDQAFAQAQEELKTRQAQIAEQSKASEARLAMERSELNASFQQGRAFLGQGDVAGARNAWQKLFSFTGDPDTTLSLLATHQEKIDTLQKDQETVSKNLEEAEDSLRISLRDGLTQALRMASDGLEKDSERLRAELVQSKDALSKQHALLTEQFEKGRQAYDEGRLGEALQEWEKITQALPDSSILRQRMEELKRQSDESEKTRQELSQAVSEKQKAIQTLLATSFDGTLTKVQSEIKASYNASLQKIQLQLAELEKTRAAQEQMLTSKEQAASAQLKASFDHELAQAQAELKAKQAQIVQEQQQSEAALAKSQAALKASHSSELQKIQDSLNQTTAQAQEALKVQQAKIADEQKQLEALLAQTTSEMKAKNDASLKALQEQINSLENSRAAQQQAFAQKQASLKAQSQQSLEQSIAQAQKELTTKQTQLAEEAKSQQTQLVAEQKQLESSLAQKASEMKAKNDASLKALQDQINSLEKSRVAQQEAYAVKEASLKVQSQQSLEQLLVQAQSELKAKQALIAQEAQAAEAALARSQAELKTSHNASLQKLQQQIAELEKTRTAQQQALVSKEQAVKSQLKEAFDRLMAQTQSELQAKQAQLAEETKISEAKFAQEESSLKTSYNVILQKLQVQIAELEKTRSTLQQDFAKKQVALKSQLESDLQSRQAVLSDELKVRQAKLIEEQKQLDSSLAQKSTEMKAKNDASLKAIQEQINASMVQAQNAAQAQATRATEELKQRETSISQQDAALRSAFEQGQKLLSQGDIAGAQKAWEGVFVAMPDGAALKLALTQLQEQTRAIELQRSKENDLLAKKQQALGSSQAQSYNQLIAKARQALETQSKQDAEQRASAEKALTVRQAAFNASFEKARQLYDAGKFEEARKEWTALSSSIDDAAGLEQFIAEMQKLAQELEKLSAQRKELASLSDKRFPAPSDLSLVIDGAQKKLQNETLLSQQERQKAEKALADRQALVQKTFVAGKSLLESGKFAEAMKEWREILPYVQEESQLDAALKALAAEIESAEKARQTATQAEAEQKIRQSAPAELEKLITQATEGLRAQIAEAQARKAKAEESAAGRRTAVADAFTRGKSLFDAGKFKEALDEWAGVLSGVDSPEKLKELMGRARTELDSLAKSQTAAVYAETGKDAKVQAPSEMEKALSGLLARTEKQTADAEARRLAAEKHLADRRKLVDNTFEKGRAMAESGDMDGALKTWSALSSEIEGGDQLMGALAKLSDSRQVASEAATKADAAEAKKSERFSAPNSLFETLSSMRMKILSEASSAATRQAIAEQALAERKAKIDAIIAGGKNQATLGNVPAAVLQWQELLPYVQEETALKGSLGGLAQQYDDAVKAEQAAKAAEALRAVKLAVPDELSKSLAEFSADAEKRSQLAQAKRAEADKALEDRKALVRNTYLKGKALADAGDLESALAEWTGLLSTVQEDAKLSILIDEAQRASRMLSAEKKSAMEAETAKSAKIPAPEGFSSFLASANDRLKAETLDTQAQKRSAEEYLAQRQKQIDDAVQKGIELYEQGRWAEAQVEWATAATSLQDPSAFKAITQELAKIHTERERLAKLLKETDSWKDVKFKNPADISNELTQSKKRVQSMTQEAEQKKLEAERYFNKRQAEVQQAFDKGKESFWKGKVADSIQQWSSVSPFLEDKEMQRSIQSVAESYSQLLKVQQAAQEAELKKESKLRTPDELPKLLQDAHQIIDSQTQYAKTQTKLADQSYIDRQTVINSTFQKGKRLYDANRIPEALEEWSSITPYLEKGSQIRKFIDDVSRNYDEAQMAQKIAEEAETKKTLKLRAPEEFPRLLEEASQRLRAQVDDTKLQKDAAERLRADRQAFVESNFEKGQALYQQGKIKEAVGAWTALIPYLEDDVKIRQLILKVEESSRALDEAIEDPAPIVAPAGPPAAALPTDFEVMLKDSEQRIQESAKEKDRQKLERDVKEVIQGKKAKVTKGKPKPSKIHLDEIEQLMIEYKIDTPNDIQKRHEDLKAVQ